MIAWFNAILLSEIILFSNERTLLKLGSVYEIDSNNSVRKKPRSRLQTDLYRSRGFLILISISGFRGSRDGLRTAPKF